MKKIIIALSALMLCACTPMVKDKYYVPKFERDHSECFKSSRHGCLEMKQLKVDVPECWRLVIEEGMASDNICVPEEEWKKAQIGQEWKNAHQ